MFFPRMWIHEVERIGKQRCTRFGYSLQVVGELIGLVGLLMLLGTACFLFYRVVAGTFHRSLLWLLLVPIGIGVVDTVIVGISWWLAYRKHFKYDYERRESTWFEDGEKRSFTHGDWEAARRRPG